MVELDQNMTLHKGKDAINLKIKLIAEILADEIPYLNYGLPVKFFSFDSPQVKQYLEDRFEANGLKVTVELTSQGRLTVYDVDVPLYEGTL